MSGTVEFNCASEMPAGVWRWPHFNPATEWACKGDGTIKIAPAFMDRLEDLRTRCGFPLPVNSGYRSPAYNDAIADTGLTGPHTTAEAADIRIYGPRALTLLAVALAMGFTGIGMKQHGAHGSRFVHLDDSHDTPTLWTYPQ